MKKIFANLIIILTLFLTGGERAFSVQFDLLVLPSAIFSVCDNYFCFPEVSEIVAQDVISNLNSYQYISAVPLNNVRAKFNNNDNLKAKAQSVLTKYATTEQIDFTLLQDIAKAFGTKSVILIDSYTGNDRTSLKRNYWDILELSNAFDMAYPFELHVNAVMTDNVNNIVMWSGKYKKTVTNSEDKLKAVNQAQAISQLEKIMQYSKTNCAKTISQNVKLRLFPKDVRTFIIDKGDKTPKYVPNALEELSKPKILKEFNDGMYNGTTDENDFIFEF